MNNLVIFPGQSSSEIYLSNPRSFREAKEAAHCLKNGQLLLVNLENLSPKSAQRISDYLAGCTNSLFGEYTEVGNGVYLFAPQTFPIVKQSKY